MLRSMAWTTMSLSSSFENLAVISFGSRAPVRQSQLCCYFIAVHSRRSLHHRS